MELTHSETRVLVAASDPSLCSGLSALFTENAFAVSATDDARRARSLVTQLPPFDIVLIDLTWPQRQGFDVLREARRREVHSPVLALTTAEDQEDRLEAFRLGADDCVSKPFSTPELLARVQAIVRRGRLHRPMLPHMFHFGEVEVDFDGYTARRGDDEVAFTTLEMEILQYFVAHRGRTVTRSQLLRDVWGISGEVTTRTIDRHVASLRKKIEPQPEAPSFIQTVYGIGYRFEDHPTV